MFEEKRQSERKSHDEEIGFRVVFTESDELKKMHTEGRIVNISNSGLGLITEYPLEPGHVLEWDDKHKKGKLHLASVRWAREHGAGFVAGVLLI